MEGRFVKGPYLQQVAARRAAVRVEIDPPGSASLEITPFYAPDAGAQASTQVLTSTEPRTLHTFQVDRLEPSTRYRYLVRANGHASDKGELVTAPADDSRAPFTFLVYGDDRTDDAAHASVVRAIREASGDFLVNTGDYVQDGDDGPQWQTFFDIEQPLLRDRCLFACVGNHELHENGGVLFARYLMPLSSEGGAALFGTFRWGNARFFMLNAFHSWSSGDERDWLERELAQADHEPNLVWRVVVVHHGPWAAGPHGSNPRLLDAKIPELLVEHKVDLVLSGHDHIYERGLGRAANGTLRYVVSGGGGAPLYRRIERQPTTRKAEATYHYVAFKVKPDAVEMSATRVDGTSLDRCTFTKAKDWDCDPRTNDPASAPASANQEHIVSTQGSSDTGPSSSSRGDSQGGCAMPGSAGAWALAAVAVGVFVLISFARRRYSKKR